MTSIWIDYTNHRGARRIREVVPKEIFFGEAPYHPETQWFLYATDVEKSVPRTFAVAQIHAWHKTKPPL